MLTMLKSLLQGKPFRHPVHPALVHFPIGLLTLSLVLDILGLLSDNSLLTRAAYYAMVGGVAMALLAALPGLVDYADIRTDHPSKKAATTHMILNLVAVALFSVSLLLRANMPADQSVSGLPLILSLIGIGLILYSGYLGGHIIYNDGLAVGQHRRATDTPDKTILIHSDPASANEYVAVASQEQLREGASLRAEVNGHVMAIVCVKGQVYAFQEFCTHRYGPLSEGCFDGHTVVCPWHRSGFDVRTGRVTEGPAKVDLKTYEVKVEAGQIMVRVPTG